jgi:actin-related protein 8
MQNMGAVLVVPDLADRLYIRELVHILLIDMGFKQVAVHQVSFKVGSLSRFLTNPQEGVSASYGAQMSNACVVDVGAVKTSISCIEDGLIVPDTRSVVSHYLNTANIS